MLFIFVLSLMSPARTSSNFRSVNNAFLIEADKETIMASSHGPNQDLVDVTRRTFEDMDIYSGSLAMENLRIVAEELHVTSATNMTLLLICFSQGDASCRRASGHGEC